MVTKVFFLRLPLDLTRGYTLGGMGSEAHFVQLKIDCDRLRRRNVHITLYRCFIRVKGLLDVKPKNGIQPFIPP